MDIWTDISTSLFFLLKFFIYYIMIEKLLQKYLLYKYRKSDEQFLNRHSEGTIKHIIGLKVFTFWYQGSYLFIYPFIKNTISRFMGLNHMQLKLNNNLLQKKNSTWSDFFFYLTIYVYLLFTANTNISVIKNSGICTWIKKIVK